MRGVRLLAALALVAASSGEVITLSSETEFDSFRQKHAGFALLVVAPWCGHSKALLPEFESAAKSSDVPFVKIDGTESEDLATRLDIKGYPTLLLVHRGDGVPLEYDGARQAAPIKQWVTQKLNPDVKQLASASEVKTFAVGKPVALVLFVQNAVAVETEALKAVASSAADLPCAISTANPADGALGLGAVAAPVLVAFTSHDAGQYVLPPPLTHTSMLKFGRAHALPNVVAYAAGKAEEAIFAAEVSLHLLFFHSAAIEPVVATSLSEVGSALRGQTLVATIDAGKHEEVAAFFDIAPSGSLPTPILMGFSLANGTKFAHPGELSTAAITAFAADALAGNLSPHLRSQPEPAADGPLLELVGSTFPKVAFDRSKDVLVQFYSPTCGHCNKLRPVYQSVAAKFADDDSIVIAQMDAVANDVAGLEPEGYPTVVLYSKANKEGIEYDGSRDAHDLIQFVEDARAGRNHIGGIPAEMPMPDEDDGYRVEL